MGDKNEVDEILSAYKVDTSKSTSPIFFVDKKGELLSEDKLKVYSDKLLDMLIEQAASKKDFGMMSATLRNLIELKKSWYPAAQINKNLNVNVFGEQLQTWVKARKQLKDNSDEQINKEILVTVDNSYKEENLEDDK